MELAEDAAPLMYTRELGADNSSLINCSLWLSLLILSAAIRIVARAGDAGSLW
jgi:hypothetical protein